MQVFEIAVYRCVERPDFFSLPHVHSCFPVRAETSFQSNKAISKVVRNLDFCLWLHLHDMYTDSEK